MLGRSLLKLIPEMNVGRKHVLIFTSLMVAVTILDSNFVKFFYNTALGSPGNLQILLFVSFFIVSTSGSIVLLSFVKKNDLITQSSRKFLFMTISVGTALVQYIISCLFLIILLELFTFHGYQKIYSISTVYLSHSLAAVTLGILSFVFIQWFRLRRSISIIIYALIFLIILFLIVTTIPLLTEQYRLQPQWILPRGYISVVLDLIVPSPDIQLIYGLGNFVLPIMVMSSWLLTVLLMKPYLTRIGRGRMWLVASVPLIYEISSFIITNTTLITDPILVQLVYSSIFQFFLAISHQIAGTLFAIAVWLFSRNVRNDFLRIYLGISALGIVLVFSCLQPGTPFYAVYPPFGLVSILPLGISSYLLLVGFLGSAAYISRDNEVRKQLHELIKRNSQILDMGKAEMETEIEKTARSIYRKTESTDQQIGLDLELSPDYVQTLLQDVLKEVHSKDRSYKKTKDE